VKKERKKERRRKEDGVAALAPIWASAPHFRRTS
jgi:hypothetical protein